MRVHLWRCALGCSRLRRNARCAPADPAAGVRPAAGRPLPLAPDVAFRGPMLAKTAPTPPGRKISTVASRRRSLPTEGRPCRGCRTSTCSRPCSESAQRLVNAETTLHLGRAARATGNLKESHPAVNSAGPSGLVSFSALASSSSSEERRACNLPTFPSRLEKPSIGHSQLWRYHYRIDRALRGTCITATSRGRLEHQID